MHTYIIPRGNTLLLVLYLCALGVAISYKKVEKSETMQSNSFLSQFSIIRFVNSQRVPKAEEMPLRMIHNVHFPTQAFVYCPLYFAGLGPFSMDAETRAFRWAEKSNMNKW